MNIGILASLLALSSFADEPSHAPVEKTFPEWHAVERFHSEDGFRLKPKAVQSMGIKFETLQGKGPWKVPLQSIARVKYSTGVYRLFDGWISFVLVEVVSRTDATATIKSPDLDPGDSIATAGVTELRLTEADLTSDTVDSCSH